MTSLQKMAGLPLYLLALSLWSSKTTAEINVIKKNTFSHPLLAPLSLKIAGSIRPEFVWDQTHKDDVRRRGHDGGSRFRFTVGYQLTPSVSLVGRYLWGVDFGHMLGIKHHYDHTKNWDMQRQLFSGIKVERYGLLTYGHQHGVYHDVIGGKSDLWDNDGHADADWIAINGNFTGGDRPRNSFKYRHSLGKFTLYADYLLPQHHAPLGGNQYYQRHSGEGMGIDYQMRKDLTLGAVWDQTNATISDARGGRRRYHQNFSGGVVRWLPGNWTLVSTATWYRHYVPVNGRKNVEHYFANHGYGLESFIGYTFSLRKPWLHSIQPYLAADTLRLKGNENFHADRLYLGAYVKVAYGVSFYLEHTFTSTSDNQPDTTWLTFYYDF